MQVNFVVELVLNIDSQLQAAGNSVLKDVILYFTLSIPGYNPNQPVQSSLFVSTEEELI